MYVEMPWPKLSKRPKIKFLRLSFFWEFTSFLPDELVGVCRLLQQQRHLLLQLCLHGLAKVQVELAKGLPSSPGNVIFSSNAGKTV